MSKETISVETVAFICDGCGRKALAGSEELITEWTKGGTTEGKDANGVWHHATKWHRCGKCSD